MPTYDISPDNAELVDKLAKAAFNHSHVESIACHREHELNDDEPSYCLVWEELDDATREPWRRGVREGLLAWQLSGTMEGALSFPEDF